MRMEPFYTRRGCKVTTIHKVVRSETVATEIVLEVPKADDERDGTDLRLEEDRGMSFDFR